MPFFSPVGGGGLGKAAVTSTTGSPTVDTSSRAGKTIYKFTGSGSITVGTAGTCEILVLGGGGPNHYEPIDGSKGGRGGAGGYIYNTSAILPAGTLTVTVGSGSGFGNNYAGTASRLGDFYAAGGGQGGSNYNSRVQGGGVGGSGGGGGPGTGSTGGGAGIAGQGFNGGNGANSGQIRGGGGGAGGAASGATGGVGATNNITGTSTTYGIGGGSSSRSLANSGDGGNADGANASGQSGFVVVVIG
jgi:hypothetical protein